MTPEELRNQAMKNLNQRAVQAGPRGRSGERNGIPSKALPTPVKRNVPGVFGANQNRGYNPNNTMSKVTEMATLPHRKVYEAGKYAVNAAGELIDGMSLKGVNNIAQAGATVAALRRLEMEKADRLGMDAMPEYQRRQAMPEEYGNTATLQKPQGMSVEEGLRQEARANLEANLEAKMAKFEAKRKEDYKNAQINSAMKYINGMN